MTQLSAFLLLLLLASNAAADNSTTGAQQATLSPTAPPSTYPGTPTSETGARTSTAGKEIPTETTGTSAAVRVTEGAGQKQTTMKTPWPLKKASHAEMQPHHGSPRVIYEEPGSSRTTVVVLLFLLLVALAALLVYFYHRLNRETEGGYTFSKLFPANSMDDLGEARGPRAWLSGALAFFRDRQGSGGEDLEAGGQDEEEEDREEEGCKAAAAGEKEERPPTDAENLDSDSGDYSSMEGFDLAKGAKGKREG
ncbi:uncharacterized protein si:ch211-119e14.1 [Polyodon spathula]|uniref:uncharacterized protein si:ch211-119e14.1 n=1 Tax=Polyodon spathula TaxID=7913 RepID=UPI001B7E0F28|nr:uncharacterized protein si:ch211-119e14.1 [Polyodon spathula]